MTAKEIMGKIKGTFAKTYDTFIKRPGLLPDGLPDLVRSMDVKSIVDFACGTGNIAVGLALKGYDVTGVDYSPDMLKNARRKNKEYGTSVKFVYGDITSVDLGRKFDLLLCTGNSIPHLTNKRMLTRFLRNCKHHLLPGGHLIFQQLNYDRMIRDGSGTFAIERGDDGVIRIKQSRFRGGMAEFVVTIIDSRRIPPAISITKRTIKPWLKKELVEELREAGFSGIKATGSYKGEPFGLRSKDLTVIAELKHHRAEKSY